MDTEEQRDEYEQESMLEQQYEKLERLRDAMREDGEL